VFQLAAPVFPVVEKCSATRRAGKRSRSGRAYLTVLLCLFQSYGYALFAEQLPGGRVAHPGWAFPQDHGPHAVHGRRFVMWLASRSPSAASQRRQPADLLFDRGAHLARDAADHRGAAGRFAHHCGALIVVGHHGARRGGTVAVTVAARRIPIQIPRKVMGRGRIREGQKTFIPPAHQLVRVMPIIFAQSLIIVPGTIATFSGNATLKHLAEFTSTSRRALPPDERGPDHFLRVFLHLHHLQSGGSRGKPEEAGGFIPGVKPAPPPPITSTTCCRDHAPRRDVPHRRRHAAFVVSNVLNMPFASAARLLIVVGVALERSSRCSSTCCCALRRLHAGRGGRKARPAACGSGADPLFVLLLGAPDR